MTPPKYDPTITFGNVLTIFGGTFFALTLAIGISVAWAKQGKEIESLKERVMKNENSRQRISEIKEDIAGMKQLQVNQQETLNRILNNLERRN